MTITATALTRAAAAAAVAGGLLFIAVQIKHPHLDATFATTTEYAVRETMKIFMTVFSLIGITGIYLRQVRQIGVLGLIGYVLLGVGYLAIFGVQVVGVFVLPSLAASQPGYVNDVFAVATSGTPVGDVGTVPILFRGGFAYIVGGFLFGIALFRGGFAYIVGGFLFGIALFRANVLARWAAVLLSVGAVATVATSQLPELTQRLFAIPVGVALIGLGYSLWRSTRRRTTMQPSAVTTPAS
jgi:hypothetical protein